jgi:CRP-like cAMP-binding protein
LRQLGETALSEIGGKGWLSLLHEDIRRRVLERCTAGRADRGKALYHVGEQPDGLYFIASGCIRLDTVQSVHGPTTLTLFHAGSWIGEVELFSGMPRLTTPMVLRPATYFYLSRTVLEGLSREHPEIWRALGHLAAEHVALAVASLDDMMIRTSSARLAAVLLRLCGARLDLDPAGVVLDLDVTQTELGQMANLSRSMTAELLGTLDQRGIIERSYGRLTVRDLAALWRIMESGSTGSDPDETT